MTAAVNVNPYPDSFGPVDSRDDLVAELEQLAQSFRHKTEPPESDNSCSQIAPPHAPPQSA